MSGKICLNGLLFDTIICIEPEPKTNIQTADSSKLYHTKYTSTTNECNFQS